MRRGASPTSIILTTLALASASFFFTHSSYASTVSSTITNITYSGTSFTRLWAFTVPANSISAGEGLIIKYRFENFTVVNGVGAEDFYFGNGTATSAWSFANSSINLPGTFTLQILQGTAGTQEIRGVMSFDTTQSAGTLFTGTNTWDFTQDNTFALSYDHSVGGSAGTITSAFAELLTVATEGGGSGTTTTILDMSELVDSNYTILAFILFLATGLFTAKLVYKI